MSSISSIGSSTSEQAQNSAVAAEDAVAGLGLPPATLATPASTNTVNAELVVSQFGVSPDSVSGVYGGAAAAGSNWFASVELLPAISNLSRSTAEQSLALLGIETPTVGNASTASSTSNAGLSSPATNTAIPESQTLGATTVDPLWGKNV